MIAKELRFRFEHYALLLVVISAFCAAFLLADSQMVRIILAVLAGVGYVVWGIWTHRGEVTTLRLMLEYILVAILGSSILIILTRSV